MSQSEIDLLQHELLLRGIPFIVPVSVYHMDYHKALFVCMDMYSGFTFRQSIDAYDKDVI